MKSQVPLENNDIFKLMGLSDSLGETHTKSDTLDHIEITNPVASVDFLSRKAEEYGSTGLDLVVEYVPKLILVGILLWLGFKLIKKLRSVCDGLLEKIGFSKTMRPFLTSIITGACKVGVLLICAGIIGVQLSIFASIIAASIFAVGLSLQGSLGNFASGILVLTLKPYEVGQWISLEDKFGRVIEIGIFNTMIVTPGKKTLIIPNSKITSDTVTNYSLNNVIRLELEVSMPYSESFPKVRDIIKTALEDITEIVNPEETEIGIINFDSHDLNLAVRPFVHPDHFWGVTYTCYEKIKKAFSDHEIQVAYSEGMQMGKIGD